jgi:hypothetical protein
MPNKGFGMLGYFAAAGAARIAAVDSITNKGEIARITSSLFYKFTNIYRMLQAKRQRGNGCTAFFPACA